MSGEPLDLLLKSVDPEACHLIGLPDRIWVFGGRFDREGVKPVSLRDSFWRETLLTTSKIPWLKYLDRPEEYPEWWAHSGYGDLLEFERDACYLARGTVVFAESPGSFVELGALAIDPALLSRLLVVVEERHLKEGARDSFLYLGPLSRVEKCDGLCVISAPSGYCLSPIDFEAIVEHVTTWLPSDPVATVLDKTNPTHRLLLMADLVDLLLVSTVPELKSALAHFKIDMSESEIGRALKLLDFFRLVKLARLGNNPFVVRRERSAGPWVKYKAVADKPFDRARFKMQCLPLIKANQRRCAVFERPQ